MFRKAAARVSVGPDFRRADKGYDEGEASASLFVVNGMLRKQDGEGARKEEKPASVKSSKGSVRGDGRPGEAG
jgi:hypothetical protein